MYNIAENAQPNGVANGDSAAVMCATSTPKQNILVHSAAVGHPQHDQSVLYRSLQHCPELPNTHYYYDSTVYTSAKRGSKRSIDAVTQEDDNVTEKQPKYQCTHDYNTGVRVEPGIKIMGNSVETVYATQFNSSY